MTFFGGQTAIVVAKAFNNTTRDRYNRPLEVLAEFEVPGCRFRPMDYQELIDLGDVTTQKWRLTAPPVAAILDASAIDEIKVDGVSYQVVGGIKPFPDMNGSLYKVTIICERRDG